MFRAPWTLFAQTLPAAKSIHLVAGALVSKPPVLTSAVADPRWSTAWELAAALRTTARSVYARWGHPRTGRRSWALTHADRSQRREATIAYLAGFHPNASPQGPAGLPVIGLGDIRRPDGPAWFAIDIDPDGMTFTRPQALAALEMAAPGITKAPRVVFDSSSGWIRQTGGAQLRGQRGLRILIGVRSGSDIERAANAIFARLWLAGFGWATITESGRLEARTLIDMALVRNQSQADFFLPASLGPGLESFAPPIEWSAGEGEAALHGFDAVADLTPAELEAAAALQAAALAARKDEAEAVRAAYVLAKAKEDAERRGTSIEDEVARRRKALDQVGAVVALDGETQVCTRAHGWLTVREIGARGLAAFPDAYCADPAEPDYRSTDGKPTTGRAVIKRATAAMVQITSFAHGAGTQYVWFDGDGLVADIDDAPTEGPAAAADEAPAVWAGSGVGSWGESTSQAAQARVMAAEAEDVLAAPDLSAVEAAWLTRTLSEAGAFRHLHLEPHDPRMDQLALDIAGLRARSVSAMRRGQKNTTLVRLEMDPAPPLKPAGGALLAPVTAGAEGAARLVLASGSAGLDAIADAAATAARSGRPVEVLVPDASRDTVAAMVRSRGLVAMVRPSRTGKVGDDWLCEKHAAMELQAKAGYRERFFDSHCFRQQGIGLPPATCPYFDTCGFNRAMADLATADVIVARAGSIEIEPNALLENPAPAVLAVEPPHSTTVAWSDREMADPSYAAIAPTVRAVVQGLRAGIPVAALRDLVTQQDQDELSMRARPPRPASPKDTADQARVKTALLRQFRRLKLTPPWDIAAAVIALIRGKASAQLGAEEGRVTVAISPTFARLRTAVAASLISPAPLDEGAAAQAAKVLGSEDRAAATKAGATPPPTSTTRVRVTPHHLPARLVLMSSRPRVLHSDPTTHADTARLAAAVQLAHRFGRRVVVVVHAEATRKALQEAVGDAAQVTTPHRALTTPADLIIATAALPRHSAGGWLTRGWAGPGSVTTAGVAPLRVVPPTVFGAPSSVIATLQRLPARDDALEAFRAAAYAAVEGLVAAARLAGATPTVLILDTVPPPWPIHAVIHRDLLVPPDDRTLAAFALLAEDPFIDTQVALVKALADRCPELFATEKAAGSWVKRRRVEVESMATLAAVWVGSATPESVARMAEDAGLAESESGETSDLDPVSDPDTQN